MPPSSPDRDTDRAAARAVPALLAWFADHARDLPWRTPDRSGWGVLVSEIMLQQTQVSRVEPRWRLWMENWPDPASLAAANTADVLRAWQGLGYPRRALRLQQAAAVIAAEHGGRVPDDVAQLRALPGVGDYTAAAVASFAYGRHVAVLDTNVRRVLARWRMAEAGPRSSAVGNAERREAERLLPEPGLTAAWNVALMELGALVCTARTAHCEACPLRTQCGWLAAGRPAQAAAARRQPRFQGSDRQARGFLLRHVAQEGPTDPGTLMETWAQHPHAGADAAEQARRALASLLDDGLLVATADGDRVALPEG